MNVGDGTNKKRRKEQKRRKRRRRSEPTIHSCYYVVEWRQFSFFVRDTLLFGCLFLACPSSPWWYACDGMTRSPRFPTK